MKFSISQRDKLLLVVLVSALMIFLAYYFGYSSLIKKTSELQTEISSLKTKYNDLQDKAANAEKYEQDTYSYNQYYEETLDEYGTGFSQKATLVFSSDMEETLGVWLNTVNLAEAVRIYSFGNVTSSNPTQPGTYVYTTDLTGYKKTTTYSYQCSYEAYKSMLAYILDYDTRYVIEAVSSTYNSDEDIVSGSFSISQYVITGADREYEEEMIDTVPTGTDNIFLSSTYSEGNIGETQNGSYIITNYDLALTLNSEGSDLDSVVLGRKGMVSSQVSDNSNGSTSVTVVVNGENGSYTVSYAVGDNIYPSGDSSQGASFNPGKTMDMIVYSSARTSAGDTAGVTLNVINNSDMSFNIKVVNDDEASPRFRLGETVGDVAVFR